MKRNPIPAFPQYTDHHYLTAQNERYFLYPHMTPNTQKNPITDITGIGPVIAKKLAPLNIHTIRDLFWHIPFRYEDYTNITSIAELQVGTEASVRGILTRMRSRRTRRRMPITEGTLTDATGTIQMTWFHQQLSKQFPRGSQVTISGTLEETTHGLQFINPYIAPITHEQLIIPIYPTTKGVTSRWLYGIIKREIHRLDNIRDTLDPHIRSDYQLINLTQAIQTIHLPKDLTEIEQARKRLAFDELLAYHLAIKQRKIRHHKNTTTPIPHNTALLQTFISSLPFTLTTDQTNTISEILNDMNQPCPMNRLVQGDVGSGKTVVACAAMLMASHANHTAILLTPTDILAQQHEKTINSLLKHHNISTALLTANNHHINGTKTTKEEIIAQTTKANINILIGTHALLYNLTSVPKLGLVVIDEQHRFGVKQRKHIHRITRTTPHLLSLSATPIPRTLALTLYGDLDISSIKQLPAHKKPITTFYIPKRKRTQCEQFVNDRITAGEQAFVVCPLIDESDILGITSVTKKYEELTARFPKLSIAMLHGKLTPAEKQSIIKKFQTNTINILVSTTVIEVGIDIPNATIMIIDGAQRFGLAQLHQIRGRVGRGAKQSWCFLFADTISEKTKNRLSALIKSQSGFDIAEQDLRLRGQGDIIGLKQSGELQFKIANPYNTNLLEKTYEIAKKIITTDENTITKFHAE
jgi:ATP-dependent DNA helicase RecG